MENLTNAYSQTKMKKSINISHKANAVMVQDAIASFPNECCGFFFGKEVDSRIVEHALPVTNEKKGDQRRRFSISPLDYMRAEQHAEAKGVKLLGIYHSHPLHPAWPSVHDRVQAMPWFSYVILSVNANDVTHINSFQLNEARLFELETII
ncbi:MAG: proteasome lid subunit RPN8/RPN11 [Litorivivens sp.]|jgi:proteasome lid subunit RPN8/RPN11